MPKKKPATNQFGPVTGTTEAGAPGDEKPAVKFKKDGTPWKVREKNKVNPKIEEFRTTQQKALDIFVGGQKAARKNFMTLLRRDVTAAKLQARMERTALAMTPAELEWLKNQAANILDAKAAAKKPEVHADPEPEERQGEP